MYVAELEIREHCRPIESHCIKKKLNCGEFPVRLVSINKRVLSYIGRWVPVYLNGAIFKNNSQFKFTGGVLKIFIIWP